MNQTHYIICVRVHVTSDYIFKNLCNDVNTRL